MKIVAIARAATVGLILLPMSMGFGLNPTVEPAGIADWTLTARIATPYDYPEGTFGGWEEAVDRAVADGANVILDWHAVSDSWKALYEPLLSQDLQEVAYHADYVHTHHPGVRYVVYVAPFEYVTPGVDEDQDGRVDPGKEDESLALRHPDWLQVGIDGRKAVFYGSQPGMPFWVCETCEDVWLTPAHPEYRDLALDQARRIAAAGVDGVWFDVPFLRFDFGEGWQEQWPTFDPWAVAQFEAETGFTVPQPPDAHWPDWADPAWRAFVKWRYTLTSRFIADYQAALKSVNPDIQLIVETSVGPDVSATQQGSSTLDLPAVSDLTAHEHGGPRRSAETHYYMWLRFLADLLFWQHTDGAQPAWLLSYVYAGEPDTLDVARLHAATVLTAGMNYYTSGNETMAGMPDESFRRQLFSWLASEESLYYGPWRPYANVVLVYSQQTLDFLDRGSWESDFAYHDAFSGMAMMLLESQIPFEVLSERELHRLMEYELAILPMFAAMSPRQAQTIRDYVASGGKLIATGPTSLHTEEGVLLGDFQLADVFGISSTEVQPGEVYVNDYGSGRSVFFYSWESGWAFTPELDYFWSAEPWEGGVPDPAGAERARNDFLNDLFAATGVEPLLAVTAPRGVVLLPYRSAGGDELAVRALNFYGVDRGDAVPTPTTVEMSLRLPSGTTVMAAERLEFLGGRQVQDFAPTAGRVSVSFPLQDHVVVELQIGTPGAASVFWVSREGEVHGRAFYCGLPSGCFNTGRGADLAEWVWVSEPVGPGDVLEMDLEHPGSYRRARTAFSPWAIGVVSRTPGVVLGVAMKPPLRLRRTATGMRALLALLGTVWVKATAEGGPIRPGDLLTTAPTPGYVMRCHDLKRCSGALLGKALDPLETEIGWIRMLVMP